MDRFEVLSLIDVMQGDIVSDKRVKVDLLKLIHRLFDCVDGPCDTFLLAVESTESTLSLQGLLNLGMLLPETLDLSLLTELDHLGGVTWDLAYQVVRHDGWSLGLAQKALGCL